MIKSLTLGALLGGIIVFVWSAASWIVLPWHATSLRPFQNEDAVARMIAENVPQSGVYAYPLSRTEGMTPEQKKAAEATGVEKMKKGPFLFVSVRREGFESLTGLYAIGVLGAMIEAFLLTWLLLQTRPRSYWGRVIFVVISALSGAVIIALPEWNWWSFSTAYTATVFGDVVIGWFLAGLVIAKFAAPKTA